MELLEVTTDIVVGGKYKISMKSPDKGFIFDLFREYIEIDPPIKIVYSQNVPTMTEMSEYS